jgi:phospholipid-binding lipoprotein MlaA
VTNFFGNLQDGWSFINSMAQLRPPQAADSLMRFSVNTVFGLGGVLDIATEAGIEKHNEDLGKTLGRWGMPSGPYVVLPVLGPSTVRDAFTITVESRHDPVWQLNHIATRNGLAGLRAVDTRANYLRLGNLLDDAALDKYSFTRDAFLAKRNADVARAISNGKDDDQDTPSNESEKKAK